MKLAEKYDVICSGGGLSTYLCSALLAKTGRRVLIIDELHYARPKLYGQDCLFDPDFGLLNRLDPEGALGASLVELGIVPGNLPYDLRDSVTQVLGPDYRIVFGREFARTDKEIGRELGKAGRDVSKFFKLFYRAASEVKSFGYSGVKPGQAPAAQLGAWKKLLEGYYPELQRHRPHPVTTALESSENGVISENLASAILGSQSYVVPVNLGLEQVLRSLPLAVAGQYEFNETAHSIRERLIRFVLERGGAVKQNGYVESLVAEKGRVTGVLLSSYEGIVRAELVVVGNRHQRLYSTLPAEIRDAGVLKGLGRVASESWRFTISVAVKSDAIPIGATSDMVVVGSYHHPLQEENYVRIQIVPAGAAGNTAAKDMTTLLITALVPYRASAFDYGRLRKLAGKMLRVTASVMPFIDERIVSVYPEFRRNEQELREAYPFEGPDRVPENLLQYYVRGHRLAQDFWGLPWATPHRNLYFSGRVVWPSLGSYGEALVARRIYEDVIAPK